MRKYSTDYIDAQNIPEWDSITESEHYVDKKLKYKIFDDAIILPFRWLDNGRVGGGIVKNNGEHYSVIDVGDYKYDYNEDSVQVLDACSSVCLDNNSIIDADNIGGG